MSKSLDRRMFVGSATMLATTIVGPRAVAAEGVQVARTSTAKSRVDTALRALDGLADEIMRRSGIPGMAIAVVADGRVAHARGYGVRRTGEGQPVDPDTVFQLASLSKSIASTVVARQVNAGVVTWEAPVVKHLPWFKLADAWVSQNVTIADMFSHRSGLPEHCGDDLEDVGFDRRDILERLHLLPLNSFRDGYAYTNFGLTAAAEAVAVASGEDWASLSEQSLYAPLGMKSTSSRFSDFEQRTNRAAGHARVGDTYQIKLQRNPDAQSPAGGVSSSVNDLARWMIMLLASGRLDSREFISPKALMPAISVEAVSRRSSVADVLPDFYGYGFGVGVTSSGLVQLSHSGAFALGAGTRYVLLPSAGVGIAILTNAAPCGAAEALATAFTDLVEYGRVREDWFAKFSELMRPLTMPVGDLVGQTPPLNPIFEGPTSSYAGTYANPYFGEVTITVTDGHLQLRIGPQGMSYALRHWQGDVFAISPLTENQPYGSVSSVTFNRAGNKAATAAATDLKIDYLDTNGFGSFARR